MAKKMVQEVKFNGNCFQVGNKTFETRKKALAYLARISKKTEAINKNTND